MLLGQEPTTAIEKIILRHQVLRLIGEVLDDPDVSEDVRLGLLRHLADNPGEPERALIAHLNDWMD